MGNFANHHNIAPAALPAADRVYADTQTQAACEAWYAGHKDAEARAGLLVSLIDAAMHFKMDSQAVDCLKRGWHCFRGKGDVRDPE